MNCFNKTTTTKAKLCEYLFPLLKLMWKCHLCIVQKPHYGTVSIGRCFKHGVSIHLKDYEYFGLLCLLTVQGVPRLITAEVKHNQSLVGRHRPGVLVGWNAQGSPSGFSEPQQTQSQVFRPWLLRPSNKGFILLLTSPFSLLCQRPLNVEANMTGHFV